MSTVRHEGSAPRQFGLRSLMIAVTAVGFATAVLTGGFGTVVQIMAWVSIVWMLLLLLYLVAVVLTIVSTIIGIEFVAGRLYSIVAGLLAPADRAEERPPTSSAN